MLLLSGTPDGFKIIYNLSIATAYFIVFLRYTMLVVSIIWVVYAILNLYAVASAQNGQPSKFLATKSQPTATGAWIQLAIAGMLFILSKQLVPAAVFAQLLTGSADYVDIQYSVGGYVAPTTGQETYKLIKGFIRLFMQFIGLMAWFRGYIIWYNIAQGTSDARGSKVIGYFIFGTLCFCMPWFNDLLVNTLGFDFFSMVFN